MRKMKKPAGLAFLFVALIAATALFVSAADTPHTMTPKMSAGTETGATISWDSVSGVDHYDVTYWTAKNNTAHTGAKTIKVTTNSCVIPLVKDTYYQCDVVAYDKDGKIVNEADDYAFCAAVPGQISTFTADHWGTGKGGYFVSAINQYPNTLGGAEWRLLSRDGKTIQYSGTITDKMEISVPNAPLNQVYQLAVRGLMKVEGTTFYGPWHTQKVVPQPKIKKPKLVKGGSNKIKLKWKKVSGATKYIIYGSTKPNSGYKKIATVKKSKSSCTITKVKGKKLKKNQNYYFKLQAVSGKVKSTMTNYWGGHIYTKYR